MNKRQVTLTAPAKINLYLGLHGVDDNGYHLLETVLQSISLADEVTLQLTPSKNTKIQLSSQDTHMPLDQTNIAWKAAELFFQKSKTTGELQIHIDKKIPSQAGLGGGSSDGAAVLVGLNHFYENLFPEEELSALGAHIGVDVPFCIQGGTKQGTHYGEELASVSAIPPCNVVLAVPPQGVSTREAFQASDQAQIVTKSPQLLLEGLKEGRLEQVGKNLHNDFQQVVETEDTLRIVSILSRCGAVGSALTGTGSGVFGLFPQDASVDSCKTQLENEGYFSALAVPVSYGAKITK